MFGVGDAVNVEVDGKMRSGCISRVDSVDRRLPYLVSYIGEDGLPVGSWFEKDEVTPLIEEAADVCASSVFVVGDVVTLLSGGPYMTVAQLNGSEIGCAWFEKNGDKVWRDYFPSECLARVIDEP